MVLDKLLKNEKQILTWNNGAVKFYGNGFIKCIVMKCVRQKGFEIWAKSKHDKLKEYMERVNLEREFEDCELLEKVAIDNAHCTYFPQFLKRFSFAFSYTRACILQSVELFRYIHT